MKKLILLELCLLFLATTFQGDRLTGWVQQTIPRPDLAVKDLCFTDTLNGFYISSKYTPSDSGFIFRTSDGGQNWSAAFIGKVYLTSIHFVNNLTGYCVGRDTIPINGLIKKTTNGGLNWFNCTDIYNAGILEDVFFPNNDTGWVCSTDLQYGGLWRTTDGGLSWQQEMNAGNKPQRIFFVNDTTGWVIGNNYNIYKTTNTGDAWYLIYNFSNTVADIFFASSDSGWIIGGGANGMMRTTNGGTNWHAVNNPSLPYETRMYFINNTTGWAGINQYKILATKNGFDWGTQNSPIVQNYFVSFADTLHGWAGSVGLVHTSDGGGPITYSGIKRNGDFVPSFELGQNYPNPFNASTRLKFSILKPCYVDLVIYNIAGKEIARVISGKRYDKGDYSLYFDAGKYSITSGVYFYLMKGATIDNKEIFLDTKKMILLK